MPSCLYLFIENTANTNLGAYTLGLTTENALRK